MESLLHEPDRLKEIFSKQIEYQAILGHDGLPAYSPDKLMRTFLHTFVETAEIAQELEATWKNWKKNPKEINFDKIYEEIADLTHLLINIALMTGMDDEMFFKEFIKKNGKNRLRTLTGY